MTSLRFSCIACRDMRPVTTERLVCLCGAVSARYVRGTVILAGPGILVGETAGVTVHRPSVVGT